MDSPAVQQRIKELAKTLRSTGIAASETRAEEMARDIVRTEVRQQERLDQRRNDPSLNPQQRTGSETRAPQSFSIDSSIPQDKPISELLAEDRQQTSAFKRPESFEVNQSGVVDEVVPTVETFEDVESVPQQDVFDEVEEITFDAEPAQEATQPVAAPEPKPEPVMEFTPSPTPQPKPAPMTPAPSLQGGNSAQKAFGLLLNNATQQQAATEQRAQQPAPQQAQAQQSAPQQPAPQQAQAQQSAPQEQKAPAAEKKAEAKVDLSEMFNFSKK